jgi:hypothetical protein
MKKLAFEGTSKMIGYVIVLNLFLSFVFYPKLLTYQADSMAGRWFYENKSNEMVYLVDEKSHAFNFYSKNSHKILIFILMCRNIILNIFIFLKDFLFLKSIIHSFIIILYIIYTFLYIFMIPHYSNSLFSIFLHYAYSIFILLLIM